MPFVPGEGAAVVGAGIGAGGKPASGPTSPLPCVGDMEGRFCTGDGKLPGIEPDDAGRWLLKEDTMFLGIDAWGKG